MHLIDSARSKEFPDQKPIFTPMFGWELNARARQSLEPYLPFNTCQFSDINHLIKDKDKKMINKVHQDSKGDADFPAALWEAIKKLDLEPTPACSKHLLRQGSRQIEDQTNRSTFE